MSSCTDAWVQSLDADLNAVVEMLKLGMDAAVFTIVQVRTGADISETQRLSCYHVRKVGIPMNAAIA